MGSWVSLVLMLAVFGGMMFFMNRSQKKKQKKEEELRNSVQVGDEITTIGGFVVRVISVKDDHYIVESPADHSKSKLMKWAMSTNNTEHSTK